MQATSFQTLLEALESAPAERPFATMWHDEDDIQSVTFGEFRQAAGRQAAYFRSCGLNAGETVVLVMPQGIPLMAAFVGVMLLGGVPTILAYPNFKIEPAKYRSGLLGVTENLQARLVVIDDEFPSELLEHIKTGEETLVVRSITAPATTVHEALPHVPQDPASLAFIQHSAGTTGLQKGVALSHLAVLRQLEDLAGVLGITAADRIYSWLPLYHDMGLIACFILPLVYHLPVVMQSPTNWVMQPGTMLELISEFRCTLAWTPNFALQFLARRVRSEDRAKLNLSSLRALINCSEPIRAQSVDEFSIAYSEVGLRQNALQSSYAMAENVFAVTQSSLARPPQRIWVDAGRLRSEHVARVVSADQPGAVCLVSSGSLLPGNQIRIDSQAEAEQVGAGVGEICISGDSLFDGYHNRPDLTAEALADGFFRTGDLGVFLDGELYVIGRKKDLIIVGGKNIYPHDVEEIVWKHSSIRDGRVVALGLFNPDLGTEEIVVVAEVYQAENLKASGEIQRALRNAIVAELGVVARAIYLKPPQWIVKSTAGKPARSHTRVKLLIEHPELVHEQPLGD